MYEYVLRVFAFYYFFSFFWWNDSLKEIVTIELENEMNIEIIDTCV